MKHLLIHHDNDTTRCDFPEGSIIGYAMEDGLLMCRVIRPSMQAVEVYVDCHQSILISFE